MDRRQAARYAPALGFAAYVLFASVVDPASTGAGGLSGTLLGVGLDKWLHLGTYATLGFLVAFARDAAAVRALAVVVLVVAAYGAGIEVVQAFVPARAFDPVDGAVNALGGAVGAGAWRGLVTLRRWQSSAGPGRTASER